MNKAIIAASLVLAVVTSLAVTSYLWVFDRGSPGGESISVRIEPGSSASSIATQLEDQGVISSELALRIFLRLKGRRTEQVLKAGDYKLRKAMGFEDLLAELEKGPDTKFVKVTIPEGSTIHQTAAIVAEKTHIDEKEFLALVAGQSSFLDGAAASGLEGYLYPDTYFVGEKDTAERLVRRMLNQFTEKTKSLDWGRAASLGLTPYEILTIASLIEEETFLGEERTKVSAVIHNRLRKGMKLEIDATVQYVVGKYDGRPLTQSDLDSDSPYNTRRYQGIPPGPISSPRYESIEAAMSPADTTAIYYVLTADCRRHLFTADYNEFLRAKRQIPSDC